MISDIDDTVLQTDATSLLRMARATFLGNARVRMPFEGVAAFYRALHHGSSGKSLNPMFYVSSSPWNLYDLLSEFFNLQDIPIGPVLFLRDWGLTDQGFLPTRNRVHKLGYIKEIIETFKDLAFILIGDSGQEDPEIYSEVVSLYPNRIKAVYIRNVSRDPKRIDQINKLAEEVLRAGSVLILAETTLPLAEHAAKQGWIRPRHTPCDRDREAGRRCAAVAARDAARQGGKGRSAHRRGSAGRRRAGDDRGDAGGRHRGGAAGRAMPDGERGADGGGAAGR